MWTLSTPNRNWSTKIKNKRNIGIHIYLEKFFTFAHSLHFCKRIRKIKTQKFVIVFEWISFVIESHILDDLVDCRSIFVDRLKKNKTKPHWIFSVFFLKLWIHYLSLSINGNHQQDDEIKCSDTFRISFYFLFLFLFNSNRHTSICWLSFLQCEISLHSECWNMQQKLKTNTKKKKTENSRAQCMKRDTTYIVFIFASYAPYELMCKCTFLFIAKMHFEQNDVKKWTFSFSTRTRSNHYAVHIFSHLNANETKKEFPKERLT